MTNTIESDFAAALAWFKHISTAIGKHKLFVVKACKEQCPTAWALLLLYLNPYTVFNIGEKSFYNDIKPNGEPYETTKELIDSLLNVKSVTNNHMARIKNTLANIENEDVRNFIIEYLTKSARIGITAESVNKAVAANAIQTFNCMLAHKYFDHPKSIVGKTIAVTEKLDGIRALAIVDVTVNPANVRIYTRQGKRIYGLNEVEQDIQIAASDLKNKDNDIESFVLDGELLISNRENIPSKEQYKQTVKIVNSDCDEKTGITYNVFDMLSVEEFNNGVSVASYVQRRKNLECLIAKDMNAVKTVPIIRKFAYTDEERAARAVIRLVEQARAEGKEGIMLNVCDAPYICKRTKNLLKVKVFQDCDLEIIGFQEGVGKYKGTLGALIVDYKGGPVGVGAGLTDAIRSEIWANQETYKGRVVTVQYFEETQDAEGKKSIRFPVFKEIREPGKEVSYN